MDIFNTFVIQLVIQLFTNVNADLVSSLIGSNITCNQPFLWLNTIGYIQCQKMCIRYSRCAVLQYHASLLECTLHAFDVGGDCQLNKGSTGPDFYLKRGAINEAILGNCPRYGCPSTCIDSRRGRHDCVTDIVSAHYNTAYLTLADLDHTGAYIGLYRHTMTKATAEESCGVIGGRLAVLNTPMKLSIATAAIQQHDADKWFVDGYKWPVCAVLRLDGKLQDNVCYDSLPFLCDMPHP